MATTAFPELSRAEVEDLLLKANSRIQTLTAVLRVALPYVENIAATRPTTHVRIQRQMQATRDVSRINVTLADPLSDAERASADIALAAIAASLSSQASAA